MSDLPKLTRTVSALCKMGQWAGPNQLLGSSVLISVISNILQIGRLAQQLPVVRMGVSLQLTRGE